MYKCIRIAVAVLILTFSQGVFSIAQETEPVTNGEEVPVEGDQIKLPLKNPFTPQVPIVKKATKEDEEKKEVLEEIEEKVSEVAEQAARFVEPEITGAPQIFISGILWNSERPQAIVNGKIIEVGDRLFKVPTDNKETIPELKFVDITKEGLAVAFEDKIVIIKPELPTTKE